MLYVVGGLTKVSDIDSYVEFVRTTAEMSQPTVGIICDHDGVNPEWVDGGMPNVKYEDLSPLDLKIVVSLRDDARRSASEIAAEIGVSTKTVQRHLDKMIADNAIWYDQPWDKTLGEDMMTLLFLRLRADANKVIVARRLLSLDPVHFNFMRAYSNLPGFLTGVIYCGRMNEVRKILRMISEDKDVLSVTPNVVYDERICYPEPPISTGIVIRSTKKARKTKAVPS
jgi:hypothetical protein